MKKMFFLSILYGLFSCSVKKVTGIPPVTCYQSVTLNKVTYELRPCFISDTIATSQNKEFTFLIVPSTVNPSYGFSVYGYGHGFPDYGIIATPSSGGSRGTETIRIKFNGNALSPHTTYDGYLPIHIYEGSETGLDSNFLKLKVHLVVK